jgi:hypothetical protein
VVEVELEDLLLRVVPLYLQRQQDFAHLAPHAALRGEEQVLRQLLRQRRGPARAPAEDGGHQGGGVRRQVHAPMLAKGAVLDGDHRLLEPLRHLLLGHPDAPLDVKLVHQGAVPAGDARDAPGLKPLQPLQRGKGEREISERDRQDENPGPRGHGEKPQPGGHVRAVGGFPELGGQGPHPGRESPRHRFQDFTGDSRDFLQHLPGKGKDLWRFSAPLSHSFCYTFLPVAGVAKLDKASDYESEDSRFDPWRLHHSLVHG